MKTSKLLSALFITGLFSLPSFARDLTPKARADQFFQTLTNRDSDKAFEVLFEGSLFAQAKSEELDRMRADVKKQLASSSIVGFEKVKEQAYGQSAVKLVYVLKLESHPLVWESHFYEAKTTRMLARVGFDDDLWRLNWANTRRAEVGHGLRLVFEKSLKGALTAPRKPAYSAMMRLGNANGHRCPSPKPNNPRFDRSSALLLFAERQPKRGSDHP